MRVFDAKNHVRVRLLFQDKDGKSYYCESGECHTEWRWSVHAHKNFSDERSFLLSCGPQ